MAFFLDTDHCIYALKGAFPTIGGRLAEKRPQDIRIAAIVQAELLLGAAKSQRRKRTLEAVEAFLAPFAIVPFDEPAARACASIRAKLEKKGAPIGRPARSDRGRDRARQRRGARHAQRPRVPPRAGIVGGGLDAVG